MSHADKVIEAIKAMTPEERVQSLISAGIIREDGTLMPRYGGTSTSGDIPTPETDAEQRQFGIGENRMYISADFARDLERRLAAATARAEEAWTKEVQTYYEKLEARYGRILYRLGIDPNNDPEKHVADLRAELDRLRKERDERGNRILTRCPACKNDTLVINCGHLLCVWHECPDPCLIDQLSRLTAEVERLREAVDERPLCETAHILLKANHTYRFIVAEGCADCARMAHEAATGPEELAAIDAAMSNPEKQ